MLVGWDWASESHDVSVIDDDGRLADPWAARIYNDARTRGKRHPHATRILARAWLRIIWACYRDGTCYDPAEHALPATENLETAA